MDYDRAQKEQEKRIIKRVAMGVAGFIAVIVIIALFPIVIIGAGQRGVVFSNGTGVEDRILGEGVHFRIPLVETVHKMSIKTQATSFDEKGSNSAGTADSQQVDLQVTINWHLDPSKVNKIYQNIGTNDDVIANVLANNTQDAVKQAISKYQALDIQRNRDTVAETALALLQKKVKRYDVIVENLSLTNINFSSDFNVAVEQAQVAQQKAKQAEYTVQQVKNEAQAAIAKANGEAEAQRQVQQSLTPELLKKMAIEKWNGVLPPSYGNAPLPFLNIQ